MSASWKTSAATVIALVGLTAGAFAQDAASPSPAPAVEAPPAASAQAPAATPAPAAPATTAQTETAPADAPAVATAAASPRPEGCFVAPAKLPPSDVEAFLSNPNGIYDIYGRTSVGLSNRVRGLAGSDPRTLQPILGLIPAANADQRSAIGAGLGRAAFACAQQDALYAQDIQTKIAELNAPEVVAAFVTASNDVQVAALGAGGAAAGGPAAGLSGGGDAGPFSAGLGGDEVVPQSFETYTFNGNRLVVLDDDDDDDDGGNGDVSPADSN